MSISILLAEKIAQLFLILLMGYLVVRVGLLKPEDSRVLSVIMVYLVMPCMILNAFQIDNTPEVRTGIAYSFVVAGIMHLLFLALTVLLKKPLKLDVIERCAVIYSNASALVIPLLQATLGSEYVVYSCGFIIVQLVLLWTHASSLLQGSSALDWKKVLTNINMIAIFAGVLLFLLKVLGILLLVVLALMVLLLLIPFCADVSWEQDTLTVKAGALGITFPVFQYPKPEPTEESKRKKKPKKAKAAKKPAKEKKPAEPRKKAKLTLNILCTILRGAGTLIRAVFGALRITHIRVCLGVRGEDPAAAARNYGKLQAWLYPVLGVLDRFIYLQFDELRIVPDFGSAEPTVEDRVSLRISARALFIVVAAVRVLAEFWREKVLDVFL